MSKDDRPYRKCVGVMLVNREGHIFVGERIDTPGAWQMPQGGIDKGEEAATAALRELYEETGVAAESVSLIAQTSDWVSYDLPPDISHKIWKGRYRGQKQKWFAFRYHGEDAAIDLDCTHAEFSAWKWAPPDHLVDLIVPFKRDVYRTVLAELMPLID